MDFDDTPEEAAYRAKVRSWLRENAPAGTRESRLRRNAGEDLVAEAKAWQAKKADAGYAGILRPKAWGGGGGGLMEEVIFGEEEDALGLYYGIFTIGVGMCVPTLLAYSDAETKERLVRPTIRGEKIWCQLFSEPGGGSDLAGVRTRAERDGDDWVVSGQKIWTSNAHIADYGILLVRTDPAVPKHKGMTMFWIDMRNSPGLEMRRIHQISGMSEFNEVFFTDVRVPDAQRIGEVNDGWRVSLVTLMNERLTTGSSRGPDWQELVGLGRRTPAGDAPAIAHGAVRERIADWYVKSEGLRLTRLRSITAISRGEQPGPEASIAKLVAASQAQDIAMEAVETLDQFGIIADPEIAPLGAAFQQALMMSPSRRIAGGTDEILRNIIAERVLGLPGDIRVDRDLPFRDIPTGRRD
ncbi:acyl-CoA dehydrogenase [Phenylobacterium zucineum HLK1]|uniref:Acyl-CoA dehydrogenase n=1 Tax=Phenylobacterium zucineum (strain HLK1) TaxID=450851 RepID=B4RH19_PHEZH|nr:acyl-CoA dehydrogenase [Phenylobacterium zucineum HLK1]